MTAIRAARLSASVFVEEARDIGAHDRADAQMAEERAGWRSAGSSWSPRPWTASTRASAARRIRRRTSSASGRKREGARDCSRPSRGRGRQARRPAPGRPSPPSGLPSVTRRGVPSRRNRNTQDRAPLGWTRSMKPCRAVSWMAYSRSCGRAASASASVRRARSVIGPPPRRRAYRQVRETRGSRHRTRSPRQGAHNRRWS